MLPIRQLHSALLYIPFQLQLDTIFITSSPKVACPTAESCLTVATFHPGSGCISVAREVIYSESLLQDLGPVTTIKIILCDYRSL